MSDQSPKPLTGRREEKFRNVVHCRQPNITVLLEDVHDSHNIGAVMRTCDSIGIQEIYVLYTNTAKQKLRLGKRTSAGSKKWVDVHFYTDRTTCFEKIRTKYDKVFATHLGKAAQSIYDIDLTSSIVLLFGNEKAGITEETLKLTDGNIVIPQVGMTTSLNISVACAVTLYEAFRQRKEKGFYNENPLLSDIEQAKLYSEYLERSRKKGYNSKNFAK